jgi:DNA (cytosine-5)-methyltransferase 1
MRYKFPKFDVPTMQYAAHRAGLKQPTIASPTAITLFSGLGASSLAASRLGFTVLAHDFKPEAVATLNANGFDAIQGDVREVDFTTGVYRNVRLVVGGPPCQPFSQGGRNAGENDPRDMIPDFQRAVAQILPETFLLENVRGLAGPRHRAYLDRRVSEFEAMGYVVEWRVIDAADHGVAQNRKRLFVLGRRVDTIDREAERKNGTAILWPARRRQQTMAEALGWTPAECIRRNLLAPAPAEDEEAALWPLTRPSTTVVGSFKPEVQAAPGYRSTGDGPRQNAPGSVVTTQEERLVLQGMPRDWVLKGSKSAVDLQIGNSCPMPLLVSLLRPNVVL